MPCAFGPRSGGRNSNLLGARARGPYRRRAWRRLCHDPPYRPSRPHSARRRARSAQDVCNDLGFGARFHLLARGDRQGRLVGERTSAAPAFAIKHAVSRSQSPWLGPHTFSDVGIAHALRRAMREWNAGIEMTEHPRPLQFAAPLPHAAHRWRLLGRRCESWSRLKSRIRPAWRPPQLFIVTTSARGKIISTPQSEPGDCGDTETTSVTKTAGTRPIRSAQRRRARSSYRRRATWTTSPRAARCSQGTARRNDSTPAVTTGTHRAILDDEPNDDADVTHQFGVRIRRRPSAKPLDVPRKSSGPCQAAKRLPSARPWPQRT